MSTRTEDPVDGLDAHIDVSAGGLLRRIYAIFYNKTVGLALIFLTGGLTLVGVLTKQMPDHVRLDEAARVGWLEQARAVYGGWTNLLDLLGFFHLFSSPLYLTVTALLALSIIGCTTHRLPLLYRNAYRPHTHVRPSFYTHAKLNDSFVASLPPEQARARVAEGLRAARYRVVEDPSGESLYADRFHWAPFGTAAAHAGYVIVMAGFVVSSFTGFRLEGFDLTVGIPKEVGAGSALTAEALSFTDTYDPEWSTPIDYVTDLRVTRGAETFQHEVRVNDPLIIDDIYFHQASFGISAVVRIADNTGRELYADGVPLSFRSPDGKRQYGVVLLDEQQMEVFVTAAASGATVPGLAPGQVNVEAYPLGQRSPLGTAVIDPKGSAEVGPLKVSYEREQKYTSLIVKRDPGSWVVWLGCALLIVGTCLTMGLPHRRQWVRVTADGDGSRVETATPDKPDTGRRRIFDQAVQSMKTAVEP
ncbi:cytochrome c biogenesis protein ResB [Tessaracoccus sp. OH4464_COT-324]|uniref:cytochrome c biogenesis protein ResB n=1 Tax=Tessaracoccus sp. OH4464_COT-324 TaxID=2491059 RepID=UPI000F62FFDE|nr:cytochrome c biogenesis protein ResB [Tessaracoccus sp. OH4464_COT-324]RRD47202.1 cytochrome c biogenesis protein [Tessaracoccus sp. OH4464_COT-324]